MNDIESASKRHWIVRNRITLLSAAIVLLYVVFIQWLLGWNTVLAQWRQIGFGTVAATVALMTATYLLRTWRIHDYFPGETAGGFARLFHLTQVHNVLNVMLPFRTGELSFPVLMRTEFGVSLPRATSALLVMRLLDLHALLAAGGVGLVLASGWPVFGTALWCAFLLLPFIGYVAKAPLLRLASLLAPKRLRAIISELEAGLPATGTLFARAWGMTLLNWFAKVTMLAVVLGLMGVGPAAATFGGALGGELSSVLPFHAPAGVGTYPAAITAGAVAFGAPHQEGALAVLSRASVNLHLMVLMSAFAGLLLSVALQRHPGRR
jgi:uncharacterized membrane protein YbhN (UPF0104 family)